MKNQYSPTGTNHTAAEFFGCANFLPDKSPGFGFFNKWARLNFNEGGLSVGEGTLMTSWPHLFEVRDPATWSRPQWGMVTDPLALSGPSFHCSV
jgi:hypothetical protein